MRSTRERDLEPFLVVGALVVAEWICIAVFATVVRHNGWLFHQGGDETFYYTGAWTFAHGHLVKASVGYAWSYLLAPFALAAGPNALSALPAVVIAQVAVLVPASLACFYAIGARIAGRRAGYAVTAFRSRRRCSPFPSGITATTPSTSSSSCRNRSGSRRWPTFPRWSASSLRPRSGCGQWTREESSTGC